MEEQAYEICLTRYVNHSDGRIYFVYALSPPTAETEMNLYIGGRFRAMNDLAH